MTGQKTIVCPNCKKIANLEIMPEGYATERWQGNREEVPYLRCPHCTCTFPEWGIVEYLKES